MYAPAPTEAQMAVLGVTEDDFANEAIEIWPENLQAYEVFNALATQWQFRPAGMALAPPTGLNYLAVETVLRLQRIRRAEWPQLFDDIRVMEQQALLTMCQE
ncbi:DUF1799 domain-containing protein [uncultured Massilia sp.]|uniref:DUF1799 domain-containing protein n=1 Tax=uncultured Massilia sp. TaxID=169973 RepID=UPI0025883A31|nr:DUF1799 domain-containing protein [uncultured Massilia sp.]